MTTQPTTTERAPLTIRSMIATGQVGLFVAAAALATPGPLAAQDPVSPWQNAVDQISEAMTGPIARGLSLVAIVIGGMMFAFGEGGAKRTTAGIIFGVGMAMGAANFLTWLTG